MTTSTGTGNTVTAQITGLATSQSHGFQVLAKNNVGASVSNNVWIVTTATETPVAPDPPRNLAAMIGDSKVTLTWDAPSNNGGSPIIFYEISARMGTTNPFFIVGTASSSATSAIVNTINGTPYQFVVYAHNNVGASTASNIINITPVAPDPPRNLAAMIGDSKVTLTWDAPSNNGDSPIIFYTIAARIGTTNPFFIVGTASSSATSAIVNTINGTPYQFVVYAHNNVGASTASNIINITPVAPDPPRNLAAMIGDSKVTLTWDAPSNNGDSPIIFYTIAARIGTTNPFFIVGTASSSATSAIVNTINGMPYQFVAHAHNNVGVSTASNIINTISRS